MRACLRIRFEEEKLAKAVRDALRPDDSSPPKGFTIESVASGGELTYFVKAETRPPEGVLTMLSILDEVSRLSELIERVVNEARARRTS